jgi:DNA-binding NarL/FixJ family response regulator
MFAPANQGWKAECISGLISAMAQTPVKVLVVEDEPLVRALLTSLLEADGFQIKSASNAAEARAVAKEFEPGVAILDIELGDGPSGIDLSQILRLQFPQIGLVFLTHIPEPRVVGVENRNIPKNAAYLRKDRMADTGVLKAAIEAASRDRVGKQFRDDKTIQHQLTNVSRSQLDVLRMVAMGLSNHEIAAQRGTTVRAVEHLVKRAFTAAGVDADAPGNARVVAARQFITVAGMPYANKA